MQFIGLLQLIIRRLMFGQYEYEKHIIHIYVHIYVTCVRSDNKLDYALKKHVFYKVSLTILFARKIHDDEVNKRINRRNSLRFPQIKAVRVYLNYRSVLNEYQSARVHGAQNIYTG
jgi:hypothetical protein